VALPLKKVNWPAFGCAAILAAHALLLGYSAAANSATFDEPAHLAAGAAYWRHGDFSIYSLSPPLLRLWAALPAVLSGAVVPSTALASAHAITEQHWYYADQFVYANFARFPLLLLLARWGMIPLSCLAGWIAYRWAAALYGNCAALAAVTLYCFNPDVLAHGSLATTDVGTSTAILAAAWLWWRFCRSPSLGKWALALLAVIAAHLCKYTALLLWPMMLAMILPLASGSPRLGRLILAWLGLGAATVLVLNVLYGFAGTGQGLGAFHFSSNLMNRVQRRLPAHLPVLLPRLWVEGLDAQKTDTEGGYQGFLFGQMYSGNRWYYYPAALACKLPVSVLVLGAATLFSLLLGPARLWRGGRRDERAMLEAGLVFAAGVFFLSDLNLGVRYLLPAFSFAIILISRLWAPGLREAGRPLRWGRNGLLAIAVLEALWVCPRFLSFVNFAAGGPSAGWHLLTDSDFDWGQGLIDLRKWMRRNSVPSVTLAYFGLVDPGVYGVRFTPITKPDDEQFVAVSSYYLNGLTNRMVIGPNRRAFIQLKYYRTLQTKPPAAVVGDTIFIYPRQVIELAAAEAGLAAGP
jgi:hypothetical protein